MLRSLIGDDALAAPVRQDPTAKGVRFALRLHAFAPKVARRRGTSVGWRRVRPSDVRRGPRRRLDLRRVKEMPGEVGTQRELEAPHGRQRLRFGPWPQPLVPRHDVLPDFVLQMRFSELERTALVEMRVVRPVHPGHGKDTNIRRGSCIPRWRGAAAG